jgi:hypothetical protein
MNNKNFISFSAAAIATIMVIGMFYKYRGDRKPACACNGQPGCNCSTCKN